MKRVYKSRPKSVPSDTTSQGTLWASWTIEVEAVFGKDSIFGPELVAMCVGAVLTLGGVGMFVLMYSALNSKTSSSTASDVFDRAGAILSEFQETLTSPDLWKTIGWMCLGLFVVSSIGGLMYIAYEYIPW